MPQGLTDLGEKKELIAVLKALNHPKPRSQNR